MSGSGTCCTAASAGHGHPLVQEHVLPADELEPTIGVERSPEVRERSVSVVEEHDAEPTQHHVDIAVRSVSVCASPTSNVTFVSPSAAARSRAPSIMGPRDVETAGVTVGDRACGVTGRGSGATPDVEHPIARRERSQLEQRSGEGGEHPVVAVLLDDPVLRLVTVPELGPAPRWSLIRSRVPPAGPIVHRTQYGPHRGCHPRECRRNLDKGR